MAIDPYRKSRLARKAIRKAHSLMRILQGTMALEGQGLPRKTLKKMTKQTARELIEKWNRGERRWDDG